LAIFLLTVLTCNVLCLPMSRSWFAIWFANSLYATCTFEDDADIPDSRKATYHPSAG
jgi:hypothetical protein